MSEKIKIQTEDNIIIKGARVHNLKNINLEIPRDKLIVITGLSGSGKSSLAFDTLYAEGQRRYVESLSSYARQFLGRIHKPEVDFIKGIPPAIAIEQKVNTRNPRSTVGTSTEIYDFLKLLFARLGKTYSPVSGKEVKKDSVTSVVNRILEYQTGTKFLILAPLVVPEDRTLNKQLEVLLKQGFSRVELQNEIIRIEDALEKKIKTNDNLLLVIDRGEVQPNEDNRTRLSDSVETAFFEGKGHCLIKFFIESNYVTENFSNKFELDGIEFEEPSTHLFSFNSPLGACPRCEGFGMVIGIDENLVFPNKNLSVFDGAIACWKGEKLSLWNDELVYNAEKFNFPIHKPVNQLTDQQYELLWTGNKYFKGLHEFFEMLEKENYKIQYRVLLSRYRGKTKCPDCKGSRLKKDALFIKVGGYSIDKILEMPIDKLLDFFNTMKLSSFENEIGQRILVEIKSRLKFLNDVGLSYLNLNRLSSSLSGGESQRINLATSLGSSLVGSLYILDEPSIGLHPRDTHLLIDVLQNLKMLGNTVVIVEHDEEIIKSADYIFDIGPLAGTHGGEIVFSGTPSILLKETKSLTMQYITGKMKIDVPARRRNWKQSINIKNAHAHNLKNISVCFPLNVMTVVTGVSGSGKSTLVNDILYQALNRYLQGSGENTGLYEKLEGDIQMIKEIEYVDQNPIGKSSRSNPVTYLKAYDEIRKLYAELPQSKINNFKASHFSFNVEGGRCEECQGEGEIKVEMQFMADVHLECDACKGRRFKEEVLEIEYKGKNIYDILELTVDEAINFFELDKSTTNKKICTKLKPLVDVGLGYVKLGQSSSTLSGGESQRVKLASFLSGESDKSNCFFIFDEPTTGLHFHDVKTLLAAFNALIEKGHSLLIIEHNPEIVKSADWIIDLGPEGGENGGQVVFEGTPENLINCSSSYTGKYLKHKLV
ncbi:MAG: excinuclease ABC subunit UvrA [Bacteroidales bacterium]